MGVFSRKQKKPEGETPAAQEPVSPPMIEDGVVDLPGIGEDPKTDELRPTDTVATQDIVYPQGLKLAALLISAFSSMFLVSLDRLIIATAIPQITDDFHSVTDIGWYGSAYLLTNAAFQLLFGKFYTFFNVKWVFLVAIALFEIGSALCGAAPSSTAFIVGRAVAGLGSAGIMSGVIAVIVLAVPLHKRPIYQGLFGAVFGISSIIGPLLGGAFTTKVTWRWCFYINLPFGGVAMAIIFLTFTVPDRETEHLSLKKKIMQLDLVGTTLLMPGIICLLLALQWGGITYAWSDGRIIALFTVAGVLLAGFVAVQILLPNTATVPPRIIRQRSIAAGVYATLCTGGQMMIFVYYLPLWFQAIQGIAAVDAGIRLLPMVLPMVLASITGGILVSKIGYYTPVMIFGICVMSVGAGLLTTLQVDATQAQWVGYQFIFGFGMGCTFQAPNLAAQTVLPHKDVQIGVALMIFGQLLGGSVFLSVGQNVLDSQLLARLTQFGFSAGAIQNAGATSITQLPASIRPAVIFQYNEALRKVYQVGLILTCLTIFGALALEWRSVKKNKKRDVAAAEDGAAAEKKQQRQQQQEKQQQKEDASGDETTTNNNNKAAAVGEKGDVEQTRRRSGSETTAHEDGVGSSVVGASEKKETVA